MGVPSGARRVAVLGSPIAHSRSPVIHAAAYRALQLPWDYRAIRVGESGLRSFLDGRDERWIGFSLTMPLKAEAHRIAASLDAVAMESGVVNTLLRVGTAGEVPHWAGFNTDVVGLARAIDRAGLDATRTVVLGSGSTAVSAVLAARRLAADAVTVLGRRAEAAADLARRFDVIGHALDGAAGAAAVREATLVVSTLPGPAGTALELPSHAFDVPLYDVAYDPWPSPLARRWTAAGGSAHAGLDMLVEQAIVQVRIFTTGDPAAPLPDEERVRAEMVAAAVS